MSRQSKWQRQHVEMGLCRLCSRPAVKGARTCIQHLLKDRKRKRGDFKAWKPGSHGPIPKERH